MQKNTFSAYVMALSMVCCVWESASADDKAISQSDTNTVTKTIRLWVGYASYDMGAFNNKLSSEGNKEIDGGRNIGIDLSFFDIDFKLPGSIPGVGGSQHVKIPLGIEYLDAKSQSTHDGTSVEWNLPVVGIYCAPEITFRDQQWLFIRPIGIGYYTLGKLVNADLAVSDRSGSIEVSAGAVGVTTQIGAKYSIDKFDLFVQGGYRWLVFSDVDQNPKGGFTESVGGPVVQSGKLAQDLDYSGLGVTAGVSWNF